MKDEAFREVHHFTNPAPVLILQHTRETTHAANSHWHDEMEISLLFKGLVRCYVGGKVKDVTDGKTCLVNSGGGFILQCPCSMGWTKARLG